MNEIEKYDYQQMLAEMTAALLSDSLEKDMDLYKKREFILGACFMADHLADYLPAYITNKKSLDALTCLVVAIKKNFPKELAALHKRVAAKK